MKHNPEIECELCGNDVRYSTLEVITLDGIDYAACPRCVRSTEKERQKEAEYRERELAKRQARQKKQEWEEEDY